MLALATAGTILNRDESRRFRSDAWRCLAYMPVWKTIAHNMKNPALAGLTQAEIKRRLLHFVSAANPPHSVT
jgi:hypothetical protein